MIHQQAISVKVGKTDAAVTNFPGAVPLANLADRFGVLDDSGCAASEEGACAWIFQ